MITENSKKAEILEAYNELKREMDELRGKYISDAAEKLEKIKVLLNRNKKLNGVDKALINKIING